MSAGELQKFGSFFLLLLLEDEERVKEFIQSILWTFKSEAVNLATLRKDKLCTTLIPGHTKRNWCYVQSSDLDTHLFTGDTLKSFSASL